jgi:hypothetical protein
VRNIGFDGTGVHGQANDYQKDEDLFKGNIDFGIIPVNEDMKCVRRIMQFYKKQDPKANIIYRALRKAYHILTGSK